MRNKYFDLSYICSEKDYKKNKSYYDGYAAGAEGHFQNLKYSGEQKGLLYSRQAVETCRKFANDYSISENGLGHELTPALRRYYSGMADAFEDSVENFISSDD